MLMTSEDDWWSMLVALLNISKFTRNLSNESNDRSQCVFIRF